LTQYSNTYVQRIASRFYYHLGEIDKALYLVRKSRNYEVDPWLISTDIAYSTKLGRFNKNMTLGMKMIESNKFSNRDLTELASSIGTVQLQNGSMKQARKAFDVSLKEPNENSFAQVEFVSNTIQIIPESELANYLTSLPNAFEARAHEFDSARKYDEAFKDGCRWLLDQPFSKRAALFTQHLAIAKLEEYDKGIEIGKFALHSNPRSVEILNNLAFAYSKKRKFKEARIALEKMKSLHPNDYYRTFLLATEGLLKMREGNIDDGKRLYDLAINHALDNKFPHLKDLAIYNYLLEYISTTGEVDFTYVAKLDKNSPLHAELAKRSKQT
jgi:tetratricopeptide (TPR) repeat protein